ncbi:hypothetical protein [Marinomonas shanghaiensis]|uniref:hypothetical protein n=1 Tax=Marinomonas shanghaiensis TaxID=2202418 RepID=UPI003A8E58CB
MISFKNILAILFFTSVAYAEENRNIRIGSLSLPISCDNSCYIEMLDLTLSNAPAENSFLSGEVKFDFKGKSYTSFYENGFVTAGSSIFPRVVQGNSEIDIYSGTYSAQKDAIWGNTVYFFDKGVYRTYSGAVFEGQFYATTAVELATANGAYQHLNGSADFEPNIVISMRKKGDHYIRGYNRLNIVFVGTVEYKGRKQVGVFGQRDYSPGDYLMLSKATSSTITSFIKEQEDLRAVIDNHFISEEQGEQDRLRKKANVTLPWGKIFAISAGVLMAEKSGLDSSTKTEFIESYTKDVLNGSSSNLAALQKKYATDQSAEDMLDAFNRSVRDLSSGEKSNGIVGSNSNDMTESKGSDNRLALSYANDSDCASMRINLDTLASSTDIELQSRYEGWRKEYAKNCHETSDNTNVKSSYFTQIGQKNLENCEESNEVQVGLFCSNAMAHFYEYRSVLAKGGDQSIINGLYEAHTQSAKLYIQALERLKTQ